MLLNKREVRIGEIMIEFSLFLKVYETSRREGPRKLKVKDRFFFQNGPTKLAQ